MLALATQSATAIPAIPAAEEMLTLKEVSQLLGFSTRTALRIFEHEPGTEILERPEVMYGTRGKKPKRAYRTFRVPYSVFLRVKRKMQVRRALI